MGVTHSEFLHSGHGCDRKHYWRARRQDLSQTRRFASFFPSTRIGKAEKAYNFLGFTAAFNNCFGNDDLRRRRFSAMLRAEMRRRERLNGFTRDQAIALEESLLDSFRTDARLPCSEGMAEKSTMASRLSASIASCACW